MLLALQLGRLKDNGELRPERVRFGKLNTVCETIAIARECRTLLGAARITLEYPIMRHANTPRVGAHLRGHLRGAPAGHRPGPSPERPPSADPGARPTDVPTFRSTEERS